ncbi:MAG: hypothetical protein AVDCRST_MAG10-2811, partial [uncultured Acidimicrobiales bacterium]
CPSSSQFSACWPPVRSTWRPRDRVSATTTITGTCAGPATGGPP